MSEFKVYRYKGKPLVDATITYKIDGVRLHVKDGIYKSRAGKDLYNLPEGLEDGIYEIYRNNFKDTIEVVRSSKTPKESITKDEVYRLDVIDKRLVFYEHDSCYSSQVEFFLKVALSRGYEGLVIRTEGKMYKVKKSDSIDIKVLDIIPGKGKYVGLVGALATKMGNVGTGLSDKERLEALTWKGKIIEVEYMELTADHKFRHPRFIRLREDKK